MKWFGESWGAPVCAPKDHIDTPDGERCPGCHKFIRRGDQGIETLYGWNDGSGFIDSLDWHLDCFLKEIGVRK